VGPHQDRPLEEALANAYAYNSFSFLSRTQVGYKVLWVKVYQKILEQCWHLEPAGYRSAGKYINSDYVSGAAQLLAMLLSSDDVDPEVSDVAGQNGQEDGRGVDCRLATTRPSIGITVCSGRGSIG
jgi:hypothetical protein